MYHAPHGVVAKPSRHARLFELIRQQNLSTIKPPVEMIQVVPKRPAALKRPEPLEVEFDFDPDRMLKSATNSLRRAG